MSRNVDKIEDFSPNSTVQATGLRSLPSVFLLSILIPMQLHLGPMILLPHRVILLIFFFPLVFILLKGAVGKVTTIDKLFFFATFWAVLALVVSEPTGAIVEPVGLFAVEFLGSYLIARVCIRCADDFRRMIFVYFLAILLLAPFAIIESVTHKNILLEAIPNSYPSVNAGIRFGLRRAHTVFVHPIAFGVFCAVSLGVFVYVLASKTRFLGMCFGIACTFFSLSSGAFLMILAQIALMLWEKILKAIRYRWKLFTALFVIAYICIDIFSTRSPFHVLVTYASFSSHSAYNRIRIWNYGTENVANNPMFGLGFYINNWARPEWMSASADNYWLLTVMTYGIPMGLAYFGAIVLIIRGVARAKLTSSQDNAIRAGFLISLAGIIIGGGTVHYWHSMASFIVFFLGSGIWLILHPSTPSSAEAKTVAVDKAIRYTRFERGQIKR